MNDKSKDPNFEELLELPTVGDRIQAVAKDLADGTRRYAKIDSWKLLEEIFEESDPVNGEMGIPVCYRQKYEDWCEEMPIYERIHLLYDLASPQSVAKWKTLVSEIENGTRKEDIELTEKEIGDLEVAVTKEDGYSDLYISTRYLEHNGYALGFEFIIGDAGEISDLLSPYDLADGKTNLGDDLVVVDD